MEPTAHRSIVLSLPLLLSCTAAPGQVLTPEDSLAAGLIQREAATVLSGYGEARFSYHAQTNTAEAGIPRAVLYVGHRFDRRISLFSEFEVEDAKVESEPGGSGEFAIEQLVLKFDLDRDHYLLAGLLIPRIGIMNENHLPTTFDGNERPLIERALIPSVWREIGACVYGTARGLGGLNWSLGVVNGLSSERFENGSGIAGGRAEGSHASAANLALTGALLGYTGSLRLQLSGYYGGSAGLAPRSADSLQLDSGPFGTPIGLAEANAQYNGRWFSARVLVAGVRVPDAEAINRAYGNNTPLAMYGCYAEAAADLLEAIRHDMKHELRVFARLEHLDLEASLPPNGTPTGTNVVDRITTGLTYQPAAGVVIKGDVTVNTTGDPSPALLVGAATTPFLRTNTLVNLGFGYAF